MATRFYSNVEYTHSGRGSNDPDIIYYNACIVNNNTTDGLPNGDSDPGSYVDTQVVFNDQRQLPILQNASEYNMSVIRFDLAGATKSLPLFVPRIVPGQTDIDLTIYKVFVSCEVVSEADPASLVYYDSEQSIMWQPQYLTLNNQPTTASPQQFFNTDYYFCDSYSWWADLVNTAVKAALTNVLIAIGANGKPDPWVSSPPPNLFYNPVTKLFSWSFDARFWGDNATTNYINGSPGAGYKYRFYLGIDTNLETLLTNFKVRFDNRNDGLPKWTYPFVSEITAWPQQIAIDTDPTTGQPYTNPNDGGYVRYIVTQDYQSTSGNWSPVDSVVITSTKLPITQEIIAPAPGTFGSSDLGFSSGTSGAAFQQVIADIQVGGDGADEWRQYMEYQPKAEYRLLSFNKSQEPIQNIDFLVWWRNRYDNNLYPLRLYNGSAVSIKVMFRRKGYLA